MIGDLSMIKITVSIEGMACGMCEAHINDAVRRSLPIKRVTSSHAKKQTIIITEKKHFILEPV